MENKWTAGGSERAFFERCGIGIGQSTDENDNLNARADSKPSLNKNKTVNRRTENWTMGLEQRRKLKMNRPFGEHLKKELGKN